MKKMIGSAATVIMAVLLVTTICYGRFIKREPQLWYEQALQMKVEKPQSEPLQPIDGEDPVSYTLQMNQLNITFDQGESWTTVPVEINQLFAGEYNGNKEELIEQSYVLTENRVAFLYTGMGD
ncbi:hypothetical protein MUB24_11370 [Lederbergia sp. NSJ-179]|uniref:hypothetical protein n=1 Tax=Lederbergia sp. NSJ-179 TaxID=2931402 RepID=UPI001FD3F8FA|nr:hypothetical protein [Lederbergia sp. NSJ-179]MCJ7841484.1 hypothetical protein [Lederbergia sp. NSJ-179]